MKLKDVISTADMERCGERTLPVLSMTMHDGIVLQAERFKKAIASKDLSSYKVVRRNQLVVSFPIDEGVLYIQDLVDAGIVSPAYAIWDIHANMVYPRYLGMFLRSPRSIQYYKSKLRGSTARRRTIPRDDFLCMELPEVSIAEQRKICTTLEKIKIVISECEQQINRLGEIVKSRFVEMFESATSIAWESNPVEEICELIADCPHTTAQDEGVGYPLVRTPNIGKGRLIYDKMHRVSEEVYNLRNKRAVPRERDLILAREAPAGNIAVIQKDEKVCLGQRTVLLRPRLAVIDSEYMAYRILSEKVQRAILDYSSGSTVAHLNVREIRKLKLPIPPLALQREFAAFVEKVDKLAFAARRRRDVARQLYRAKIQEFFG